MKNAYALLGLSFMIIFTIAYIALSKAGDENTPKNSGDEVIRIIEE